MEFVSATVNGEARRMRSAFSFSSVRIVVATLGLGLNSAQAQAPAQQWDAFVASFLDRHFAFHPDEGVAAGRHEFDGQLSDFSDAGMQREIDWLQAERTAAEAYPASALTKAQSFEREYLVMEVRKQLFWLKTADQAHTNPYAYADAIDPDTYVSRPYAPLPVRLRAYLKYARAIPAAIEQIKHNLDHPIAQSLLEIGHTSIGGIADFYATDIVEIFAPVKDAQLQAEFKVANAAAIKAVQGIDAWLVAKEKTAQDNFALGPVMFQAMVRETEGVDLPLEQLSAIAQKDLERNYAAMVAACAQYAPGKTPHEAAAIAFSHKPTGSTVAYATQQLIDLRKFILAHQLVSIPGTETAQVAEAPAYRRWNFAYINIPGPYEKALPSTYYVSPPDPTWPQEKQDAYVPGVGPLLFTSAHEVYPGHFVQFLHANRSKSKFGRVFVGYAFAEGWAHYCEEMMYDAGLGDHTPEMHIGQLEEALLRNVRFVSAIGLHTRGMTVAQSKQLFLDKGFQDEADAEQQAARGAFDPAYLNYTLGKLMIRKLREDWTATHGGRKAWKEFHDQFLQYGGPPIPLVRKAMMGSADPQSLF